MSKRSAERSKKIPFQKLKDVQAGKREENLKTIKLNIVTNHSPTINVLGLFAERIKLKANSSSKPCAMEIIPWSH